jgi:hypothetical protein
MTPVRFAAVCLSLMLAACQKPAGNVADTPAAAAPAVVRQALPRSAAAADPTPDSAPDMTASQADASSAAEPLPDPIPQKPWNGRRKSKPAVHYHNGKLVADDTPRRIDIVSEFQEPSRGKLMVPAFLGDMVYMSMSVQTEGHTALKNAAVDIRSQKGNRYLLMADRTDKDGYLEFRMLATQLGKDLVKVSAAGVEQEFVLDVSSYAHSEWLGGLELKGVTSWDLLMSADVKIGREQFQARFPAPVQELKDKIVRLAGFMMPLGINEKQTHFLLSAVPPSCFFHPPGGPSSAVEVYADHGIEMADEPMVLEGRFQLFERSEGGILYELRNARLVPKGE